MNIRHSLLLTCALSASVLLSACGGDENLQLGSRDDIIIMKNGVPVDGSVASKAVTTSPSDMTVDTAVMVPSVEAQATDAAEEEIAEQVVEATQETITEATDDAKAEMAAVVEEAGLEPVTEIDMAETAVTDEVEEAEEIVETAQAELSEKMQSTPMKQEMKQAKSVNTELMTAELAEDMAKDVAEQNVSQPMATTPMKSAMVTETPVEEKPETETSKSIPEEDEKQAKVEGGCYRNMLISKPQAIPVLEERRIVCEKDLTPSLVAIVQQALISRDVKLGAADGKLGNQTMNAIETYQRENGLAVGGMTYELLDHLNIKI